MCIVKLFSIENVSVRAEFSSFAGGSAFFFFFSMKKTAAESHRMLSSTYGEDCISERTCREWFQRFRNGDFNMEDRHSGGREKVFEDAEFAELEALLSEDSRQTQEALARSLGGDSKPFQNVSKPWV